MIGPEHIIRRNSRGTYGGAGAVPVTTTPATTQRRITDIHEFNILDRLTPTTEILTEFKRNLVIMKSKMEQILDEINQLVINLENQDMLHKSLRASLEIRRR